MPLFHSSILEISFAWELSSMALRVSLADWIAKKNCARTSKASVEILSWRCSIYLNVGWRKDRAAVIGFRVNYLDFKNKKGKGPVYSWQKLA